MDEWRQKFTPSDVSNISGTVKPKDILLELRTMNNNYIEFFAFMMGEIAKLKTDANATNEKIDDLQTSMEAKHEEYDLRFSHIETQLKVLEAKDVEKEEKLIELECRSRKLNLIIPGLEEKHLNRATRQGDRQNRQEETYSEIYEKVMGFLVNKVGILTARSMMFRNIHRLGKRSENQTRPRNVIVAFIHQPDVDTILTAVRELKSKEISIRTDLPKQYNDIRNALLFIRKKYRELPTGSVKCKLSYIKFKPTLFKLINGSEVKVEIAKDDDGKYHEVLNIDPDA